MLKEIYQLSKTIKCNNSYKTQLLDTNILDQLDVDRFADKWEMQACVIMTTIQWYSYIWEKGSKIDVFIENLHSLFSIFFKYVIFIAPTRMSLFVISPAHRKISLVSPKGGKIKYLQASLY